jgi:hypothetical protein
LGEKDVPALIVAYQRLVGAATPQKLTSASASWSNSLTENFAHNVERLSFGAPFLVAPGSKATTDDILAFFVKAGVINENEAGYYRALSAEMNGGVAPVPLKVRESFHTTPPDRSRAYRQDRILREMSRLERELSPAEEIAIILDEDLNKVEAWLKTEPENLLKYIKIKIGDMSVPENIVREIDKAAKALALVAPAAAAAPAPDGIIGAMHGSEAKQLELPAVEARTAPALALVEKAASAPAEKFVRVENLNANDPALKYILECYTEKMKILGPYFDGSPLSCKIHAYLFYLIAVDKGLKPELVGYHNIDGKYGHYSCKIDDVILNAPGPGYAAAEPKVEGADGIENFERIGIEAFEDKEADYFNSVLPFMEKLDNRGPECAKVIASLIVKHGHKTGILNKVNLGRLAAPEQPALEEAALKKYTDSLTAKIEAVRGTLPKEPIAQPEPVVAPAPAARGVEAMPAPAGTPEERLEIFLKDNPKYDTDAVKKLFSNGADKGRALEAIIYAADVRREVEEALARVRPPEAEEFIFIPVSEKLCPVNSVTLQSAMTAIWRDERQHMNGAYKVGNVTVVFYDGTLSMLKAKMNGKALTGTNSIIFIDGIANPNSAAVDGFFTDNNIASARTVVSLTDGKPGYLPIGGAITFGAAALDMVRGGDVDAELFARTRGLMEKMSGDPKFYADIVDARKFIDMLKSGTLRIILPPATAESIDYLLAADKAVLASL